MTHEFVDIDLPPKCCLFWSSHSKTHLRKPLSDSESLIGVYLTNSLFDLPRRCSSIWKRQPETHLKKPLSDSESLIGVYFTNSLFDLPPKCSSSWKRLWVVMSYLWMRKLSMICTWRIQFVMFWRLTGFVKFLCLTVIPMNVSCHLRHVTCVMSPESICVASSNESEPKWVAQRLEL